MEKLHIKRKKAFYYRSMIWAPIALFEIVRSLISNLDSSREYKTLILLLLFALGILCSALLTNSIVQVLKKTPALIINDDGLTDNISFSKSELIKWDNISSCKIKKFKGTLHVIVGLKDHSEILARQGDFKRRIIEIKIKELGTPIAISTHLIAFDIYALKGIIELKAMLPNNFLAPEV